MAAAPPEPWALDAYYRTAINYVAAVSDEIRRQQDAVFAARAKLVARQEKEWADFRRRAQRLNRGGAAKEKEALHSATANGTSLREAVEAQLFAADAEKLREEAEVDLRERFPLAFLDDETESLLGSYFLLPTLRRHLNTLLQERLANAACSPSPSSALTAGGCKGGAVVVKAQSDGCSSGGRRDGVATDEDGHRVKTERSADGADASASSRGSGLLPALFNRSGGATFGEDSGKLSTATKKPAGFGRRLPQLAGEAYRGAFYVPQHQIRPRSGASSLHRGYASFSPAQQNQTARGRGRLPFYPSSTPVTEQTAVSTVVDSPGEAPTEKEAPSPQPQAVTDAHGVTDVSSPTNEAEGIETLHGSPQIPLWMQEAAKSPAALQFVACAIDNAHRQRARLLEEREICMKKQLSHFQTPPAQSRASSSVEGRGEAADVFVEDEVLDTSHGVDSVHGAEMSDSDDDENTPLMDLFSDGRPRSGRLCTTRVRDGTGSAESTAKEMEYWKGEVRLARAARQQEDAVWNAQKERLRQLQEASQGRDARAVDTLEDGKEDAAEEVHIIGEAAAAPRAPRTVTVEIQDSPRSSPAAPAGGDVAGKAVEAMSQNAEARNTLSTTRVSTPHDDDDDVVVMEISATSLMQRQRLARERSILRRQGTATQRSASSPTATQRSPNGQRQRAGANGVGSFTRFETLPLPREDDLAAHKEEEEARARAQAQRSTTGQADALTDAAPPLAWYQREVQRYLWPSELEARIGHTLHGMVAPFKCSWRPLQISARELAAAVRPIDVDADDSASLPRGEDEVHARERANDEADLAGETPWKRARREPRLYVVDVSVLSSQVGRTYVSTGPREALPMSFSDSQRGVGPASQASASLEDERHLSNGLLSNSVMKRLPQLPSACSQVFLHVHGAGDFLATEGSLSSIR